MNGIHNNQIECSLQQRSLKLKAKPKRFLISFSKRFITFLAFNISDPLLALLLLTKIIDPFLPIFRGDRKQHRWCCRRGEGCDVLHSYGSLDAVYNSDCEIFGGILMGDHFVFLVDRLLTESTLEAAIESRNPSKQLDPSENDDTVIDCSSHVFTPKKLVECRICQDEDFDLNMETPCSCCGSLKYAHRRCVQRWCNEKGDTICEICHQEFKPGYTAPSPVFRLGGIPLNLRGHWQIARRDMNNSSRIIAVVAPDHGFLDQEYDEYTDSTSRSVFCFRSVAAIFVVLLFLRHALPVIANGAGSDSFPVFMLWFLRTSAIVLPIYIMMRAMISLIHRRRQMASDASTSSTSSDEGESLRPPHNQTHIAHVH